MSRATAGAPAYRLDMNTSRIALAVAITVASATGALGVSDIAQMTTPTRNIGCIGLKFDGKYTLRCDIRSHTFTSPKQPRACQEDYGDSFSLAATGEARWTCHGDTALPPPNGRGFTAVAYGQAWTWGPFTCWVRLTGITCRNRSAKGFFLSKQAARRV